MSESGILAWVMTVAAVMSAGSPPASASELNPAPTCSFSSSTLEDEAARDRIRAGSLFAVGSHAGAGDSIESGEDFVSAPASTRIFNARCENVVGVCACVYSPGSDCNHKACPIAQC
jgi:hypothetical protein